jgi:hypothetical protein
MKAKPASKTSCMLQAIGSVQNHMNIISQPLSLTNTISPTLILSTHLCIVTARGLILSYLQNKTFMQFISVPCLLERSTSLVLLFLISTIPKQKSHYWLQKHVQSKHLSTQLVHVFTELRTETPKRGSVFIYLCICFSLNFVTFENIIKRHSHNKP